MSSVLRHLPLWQTVGREGGGQGSWDELDWRYKRRRSLLRRILIASVCVIVVATVVGVSVVRAHGRYENGRKDLAAGRYERAAREFAAASVFSFAYRDADMLEAVAERQARAPAADGLLAPSFWPREYSVLMGRALRDLRLGHYLAAAATITKLREKYPGYPLDVGRHGARLVAAGAEAMLAAARGRFEGRRWKDVEPYVAAALVLQPDWPAALGLQHRAASYAAARPLFAEAQAQAAAGHWAQVVTLLRKLATEAPGYPGAYTLMSKARAKLAKPKPAPETAAPTPSATPTPKPRPTPAPTPTLPPPP